MIPPMTRGRHLRDSPTNPGASRHAQPATTVWRHRPTPAGAGQRRLTPAAIPARPKEPAAPDDGFFDDGDFEAPTGDEDVADHFV